MPASHFDVKPMTGRPKFIVRHSTILKPDVFQDVTFAIDHMNLCIFIFFNKTTNGGSENNLVYYNAREPIVQNRNKRYNTSQKGL
jgi:hypothetical protein